MGTAEAVLGGSPKSHGTQAQWEFNRDQSADHTRHHPPFARHLSSVFVHTYIIHLLPYDTVPFLSPLPRRPCVFLRSFRPRRSWRLARSSRLAFSLFLRPAPRLALLSIPVVFPASPARLPPSFPSLSYPCPRPSLPCLPFSFSPHFAFHSPSVPTSLPSSFALTLLVLISPPSSTSIFTLSPDLPRPRSPPRH
ncbi:hypothetical protein C8R44DRAFT_883469 [Mycena epipterygia]|nr:hypothetical protein C8R44DRAFT_883469 [Mycena epipterygia]